MFWSGLALPKMLCHQSDLVYTYIIFYIIGPRQPRSDQTRNLIMPSGSLCISSVRPHMCANQMVSSIAKTTVPPQLWVRDLTVDPKGVIKLLNNLANGPDGLTVKVLKECCFEIAPILASIYNGTLAQGAVHSD